MLAVSPIHSAFVKEYKHKRDLMFADDVKAGWCPSPMLDPEDMVYAYRKYIGNFVNRRTTQLCL